MFFQVQLGLLIASCGFLEPILIKLGLGWIVAQSVLSYFLAGVLKLRTAGWWNGRALQKLLRSDGPYRIFTPARKLASRVATHSCAFSSESTKRITVWLNRIPSN